MVNKILTEMKKILNTTIIAIATLAATSCTEDVSNINLPNSVPKIQVVGFISPNETISIKVMRVEAIPYNKPPHVEVQNSVVSNAEVVIKNASTSQQVIIPFNAEKWNYIDSSLSITPNTEYQILVKVDGFEPISASTTVPSANVSIINPKITSSLISIGGPKKYITAQIEDKAGEENSYRVIANAMLTETIVHDGGIVTSQTFNTHIGDSYITDFNRDGEPIPFSMEMKGIGAYDTVVIRVLSTDINYYKYHQSLNSNNDIQIFSEPTEIFSNINNGLGIFSSYTTSTLKVPRP